MARPVRLTDDRLVFVLLISLMLWLGLTSVASAETLPATCSNLQEKIEAAAKLPNDGEGDVVQLSELCGVKAKPFAIPAGSNFTLEGAGTTSGFDGEGGTESLLVSEGQVGKLTISNLTLEHGRSMGSGGALSIEATGGVTLSDDQFLENTSQDGSGGAAFIEVPETACSATSAITITGSTFKGNLAMQASEGGGAVWAIEGCSTTTSVLQGNTFEGNSVEGTGSSEYVGGALAFMAATIAGRPRLEQTDNVFDSNKVLASSGSGMYGGGGEWVQSANLLSIGDRFSRNSIPSVSGSGHWSRGGGLGIDNQVCNSNETIEGTLEDAVVVANSIVGDGEAAELDGAGIYADCGPVPVPDHFSLLDSTVTENTVPNGGIAGIDGGPQDALTIDNSILYGDVGGSEFGGFGSISASYSDVCNGSSPLTGEGNICANPMLADNGNPESVDVHETISSPTIDAGSNALVPQGLSRDFYDDGRTLVGHPSCTTVPVVVDMGAAEYVSTAALPCAPPHNLPVPGLTEFIKLKTGKRGVAVTLGCKGASTQTCSGTLIINDARSLNKQKVIGVTSSRQEIKPLKLGETAFSLAGGGKATFNIKLNSKGVSLLRRLHSLPTVVLGSEAMPKNSVFLFLFHAALFTEPKHKAHKHKKHKHKKRHHSKKHH